MAMATMVRAREAELAGRRQGGNLALGRDPQLSHVPGTAVTQKPDSEVRTVMLSWLESTSVDNVADYVSRGRRFASLGEDGLLEKWKVAFKAVAAQPSSDSARADSRDLGAEIEYRGLKPPYEDEDIKRALETLVAKASEIAGNLSPEDTERVNKEILRDLTEYKTKRDRGS
jgi:hypothetical protein